MRPFISIVGFVVFLAILWVTSWLDTTAGLYPTP